MRREDRGRECHRNRGGPCVSHSNAKIVRCVAILLSLVSLFVLPDVISQSEAPQHPCHNLHPCPSDHNTYICGDKGRCDQCPDNPYCLAGKRSEERRVGKEGRSRWSPYH